MKHRATTFLMIGIILLTMASCGCEHEFTKPTCLAVSTCTLCGKTEGELAAHMLQNATCTEPATCKLCGYTEGEKLGHEYSQATCIKRATCSRCGDERGVKLGHKYSDATCTTPQTCSVCDHTTGEALGHEYSLATCTKKATCLRCGATTGTEQGHSFLGATCLAESICSRCGEYGSALGHDYLAATCLDPEICKRCRATGGAALGHTDAGDGYCVRCREKMPIDMNTVVGPPLGMFTYCRTELDHVAVFWRGVNNSGKTINYYTVTLHPVNSLGDPIQEEIWGNTTETIRVVGPVEPGEELIIVNFLGYFPTCRKVTVGEITLEYADGTTDTGWYGWYTDEEYPELQYFAE